jgi:hypothetical protein
MRGYAYREEGYDSVQPILCCYVSGDLDHLLEKIDLMYCTSLLIRQTQFRFPLYYFKQIAVTISTWCRHPIAQLLFECGTRNNLLLCRNSTSTYETKGLER